MIQFIFSAQNNLQGMGWQQLFIKSSFTRVSLIFHKMQMVILVY